MDSEPKGLIDCVTRMFAEAAETEIEAFRSIHVVKPMEGTFATPTRGIAKIKSEPLENPSHLRNVFEGVSQEAKSL